MNSPVRRLIELSQKYAWLIIAGVVAITVFFGWKATQIQVNASVNTMLPENKHFTELSKQFGSEEKIQDYLMVTAEAPDLFTLEKLAVFDGALQKISKLPGVQVGMTPFNYFTFEKDGKKLAIVTMAEGGTVPTTEEELRIFRERIGRDAHARNLILSGDGKALCGLYPIDRLEDYGPLLEETERIIAPLIAAGIEAHVCGTFPFEVAIHNYLLRDLPIFLVVALAAILVSFYLSFRTRRSLFLPVLVVILGCIWTVGFMSLLGFQLTIANIMTPPLVLILGSSYSLHILNQYYRGAKTDAKDKKWIVNAVEFIIATIFLASSTTVFGFASLLTATLRQLREFGVATGAGIIFCALLAVFFLPAALSLMKPPTKRQQERVMEGGIAHILTRLSHWIIRRRVFVLIGVGVICVGFGFAYGSIRYETDVLSYFRGQLKAVEDNRYLIRKFGGYVYVNLTFSAPEGRQGYFMDPAVLRRVAEVEDFLDKDPDIASIMSFTSYLRLMNRTMEGAYEIPDKKPMIMLLSRYFNALSATPASSGMTSLLLSKEANHITFVFKVYDNERGALTTDESYKRIQKRIEEKMAECLPAEMGRDFWGSTLSVINLGDMLAQNQMSSIGTTALLVFLITALFLRSAKSGAYVLAPMAVGLMLIFIVMAVFHIPLDVVTVTFSSIAIGCGVDNAIHLTIQYRRQRKIWGDDMDLAIEHTLKIAGRPMILTTVSITAALLAFLFSGFRPIMYFGILISLALITTTAAALIVLPVILYYDGRAEIRRRKRREALSVGHGQVDGLVQQEQADQGEVEDRSASR